MNRNPSDHDYSTGQRSGMSPERMRRLRRTVGSVVAISLGTAALTLLPNGDNQPTPTTTVNYTFQPGVSAWELAQRIDNPIDNSDIRELVDPLNDAGTDNGQTDIIPAGKRISVEVPTHLVDEQEVALLDQLPPQPQQPSQ